MILERRTYNQLSQSAVYREDNASVSLTVCGGSYGGGSEVLVIEPIVFRDDITIKIDGGALHSPSDQETSKGRSV